MSGALKHILRASCYMYLVNICSLSSFLLLWIHYKIHFPFFLPARINAACHLSFSSLSLFPALSHTLSLSLTLSSQKMCINRVDINGCCMPSQNHQVSTPGTAFKLADTKKEQWIGSYGWTWREVLAAY